MQATVFTSDIWWCITVQKDSTKTHQPDRAKIDLIFQSYIFKCFLLHNHCPYDSCLLSIHIYLSLRKRSTNPNYMGTSSIKYVVTTNVGTFKLHSLLIFETPLCNNIILFNLKQFR